jgi:hypothetical protein
MPVSMTNSQMIYDALKACDVRLISALRPVALLLCRDLMWEE